MDSSNTALSSRFTTLDDYIVNSKRSTCVLHLRIFDSRIVVPTQKQWENFTNNPLQSLKIHRKRPGAEVFPVKHKQLRVVEVKSQLTAQKQPENQTIALPQTGKTGSVSTNSGNTQNARKRPASDSSGADVTPQKRAKKEPSTISENRAGKTEGSDSKREIFPAKKNEQLQNKNKQPDNCYLDILPIEMLHNIAKRLNFSDFAKFSGVGWRNVRVLRLDDNLVSKVFHKDPRIKKAILCRHLLIRSKNYKTEGFQYSSNLYIPKVPSVVFSEGPAQLTSPITSDYERELDRRVWQAHIHIEFQKLIEKLHNFVGNESFSTDYKIYCCHCTVVINNEFTSQNNTAGTDAADIFLDKAVKSGSQSVSEGDMDKLNDLFKYLMSTPTRPTISEIFDYVEAI